MTPDVLLAGHIVKDITPEGWRLGGGVHYAAAQFSRLGLQTAVVTSCANDLSPPVLRDVDWKVTSSPLSTTFENRYADGHRTQRLHARARGLSLADVPEKWRRAPIILLAPVMEELDETMTSQLAAPGRLVAVGAQGWLRDVAEGRVAVKRTPKDARWLEGSQVVFVSDEDVADPESVGRWQSSDRIVVRTRGRHGYVIYESGRQGSYRGAVVLEADATGAGDVFAAAFLYAYAGGSDSEKAGRFAHAAASLSVRGAGIETVAGKAEIEAEMQRESAVNAG